MAEQPKVRGRPKPSKGRRSGREALLLDVLSPSQIKEERLKVMNCFLGKKITFSAKNKGRRLG